MYPLSHNSSFALPHTTLSDGGVVEVVRQGGLVFWRRKRTFEADKNASNTGHFIIYHAIAKEHVPHPPKKTFWHRDLQAQDCAHRYRLLQDFWQIVNIDVAVKSCTYIC
jgi:hypothetical protein